MIGVSFRLTDAAPELDHADGQAVAACSLRIWEAAALALIPIIGERGFSTLFDRCVYLALGRYPWLVMPQAGTGAARLAALGLILRNADPAEVLAAAEALHTTFYTTLAGLIGEPLTSSILSHIPGYGPASTERGNA